MRRAGPHDLTPRSNFSSPLSFGLSFLLVVLAVSLSLSTSSSRKSVCIRSYGICRCSDFKCIGSVAFLGAEFLSGILPFVVRQSG